MTSDELRIQVQTLLKTVRQNFLRDAKFYITDPGMQVFAEALAESIGVVSPREAMEALIAASDTAGQMNEADRLYTFLGIGPTGEPPLPGGPKGDLGGACGALTIHGNTLVMNFGVPVAWIRMTVPEAESMIGVITEAILKIKRRTN